MTSGFTQLKVCARTVELLNKSGKKQPTEVQQRVIPAIYAGKDVIARAQTGVGKTLAFVIPMLEKIDTKKAYVQALVMAPTRELAQQIATEIKKLAKDTGIGTLAVCGGRDFVSQKHKLSGKTHIMVGTPGRLLDHLRKGNTDLGGISYLVLDEVDEMLQQGFEEDIASVLALTPANRQTILCSATLSEEVRKLGKKITRNCVLIDVNPQQATADKIQQICIKVSEEKKQQSLASLITRLNPYLMLVFCASKEKAIALNSWLLEQGFNVDVLQGDMSQAKRKTVMKNFRLAKLQILVASDIAARGLDVEGITQVVNFDIPHDADWYVHRIGRTGRAGNTGMAITFYTADEVKWLSNLETKLSISLERQNLTGETLTRTRKKTATAKKKPQKKRGKTAVGPNKRGTKYAEASRKQKGRNEDAKGKLPENKKSFGRGKRVRQERSR